MTSPAVAPPPREEPKPPKKTVIDRVIEQQEKSGISKEARLRAIKEADLRARGTFQKRAHDPVYDRPTEGGRTLPVGGMD